jgi:anti-anti-sigma factor
LLSLTLEEMDDRVVIHLKGVIDLTTVTQLLESIENEMEKTDKLALDLSQVELIDSTGIGYIMRAILTYRPHEKEIEMFHIPPMIEETFELMGVNQILGMKQDHV